MTLETSQPIISTTDEFAETKGFLRREFLLWYWFISETKPNKKLIVPSVSGPIAVSLWVDDRILLMSPDPDGHENYLRGGYPSKSREAAFALADGFFVKEMKIGLTVAFIPDMGKDLEFTAILSAKDLHPRSVHLPELDLHIEAEDKVELEHFHVSSRVAALLVFNDIIDQLYSEFLALRTNPLELNQLFTEIASWIAQKATHAPKKEHTH